MDRNEEVYEKNEGEALLPGPPNSMKASRLITIEPLIILFSISLGVVAFSQTIYIEERLAEDRNYTLDKGDSENGTCSSTNSSDPDLIIQQEIAAELATWTMILTALGFLPVCLLAPFYGVLSDRLGRKVLFCIPMLAHLTYDIFLLFTVHLRLPLVVIGIAVFLQGFGGNYCLFLAGCNTYVSDISTEKSRLIRIAIVQMLFQLSIGSVQIPIGYLLETSIAATYWISVAFVLAALLYVIIPGVLQETVPNDKEHTVTVGEVLRTVFNVFAINTQGRRYRLLILLVIYLITAIFQLSSNATMIYTLYGLGPPFCWSSIILGYFNVTYMAFGAIGLLVGSKVFSMCLEDPWILQIAYLFGCLTNLMLAWAPSTALFFTAIILGSPRGMDNPVLASLLSKLVNANELGTIFAIESSVQSAAGLLSPLILNPIYSSSVKSNPNLIFFVIAAVFFFLIILTWLWMLYTWRATKQHVKCQQQASTKLPEDATT